ncbi:MAG: UPF0280 family protein [Candidatus Omnitrophota bacterium]
MKKDYKDRFYRKWVGSDDLILQEVKVDETDLYISSSVNVEGQARESIIRYRSYIEDHIKADPDFRDSLKPIENNDLAPVIIKDMIYYSRLAGVGPMAGVAGAIAECVGKELLKYSKEIIVENGGDIFIASQKTRNIAVFAGESILSRKISIKITPGPAPLGVCTSSGTVGHSLSFGNADACVIISKSTILADTVATAAANRVRAKEDIEGALKFAMSVDGVKGALIIYKKELGLSGDIEISRGSI